MPRTASSVVLVALSRALVKIAGAYASPTSNSYHVSHGEEPEEEPGSATFWIKVAISACLVLAGGVFAGCVGLVIYGLVQSRL